MIEQKELREYADQYIEVYRLSRSEVLLISDFYNFVLRRHNGQLKFGDEVDEWLDANR
ncbi:MAG: hypothetical protein IKR04_02265 [Clostridia bacterium]|nr:hypothetical protein [Clostridia bacterium]